MNHRISGVEMAQMVRGRQPAAGCGLVVVLMLFVVRRKKLAEDVDRGVRRCSETFLTMANFTVLTQDSNDV